MNSGPTTEKERYLILDALRGLGTRFGLIHAEITALCVFLLQIAVSRWWLKHFRFGPLEWIWRMLTYGRFFSLAKEK